MIKPTLFVNGNILCRCEFRASTADSFDNVHPMTLPDECDLSDAIIVQYGLVCASMDVKNHIIACTGEIRALYGHPTVGNLKVNEPLEL